MNEEMKVVFYPKKEDLEDGNVTFRSIYNYQVTENDLKQASLELGETEEKKAALLLKLKDTLIRDKEFHYRLDDDYLLRFLRYRKYNIQRAFITIRKFYDFRQKRPDLFVLPSPTLDFFLNRDLMRVLPYRDEKGSFIFWFSAYEWAQEKLSPMEALTALLTYNDVVMMNPGIQINGHILLMDARGFTASVVQRYVNPGLIKILIKSLQSHYPARLRQAIIFNCNSVLRGLYAVVRHLLSKKETDRVVLLGSDVNELHKYINPRILPKTFGGSIELSECSIAEHIRCNLPYVKYERSFGTNKEVKI